MDIPAYISSGILESYVLGLTSPDEAKEVETLALQYPSIRIELNKIEDALNEYASLYSKMPPAYVREKIFAAVDIKNNNQGAKAEARQSAPQTTIRPASHAWKWFAAAASVALLISVAANYQLYQDLQAGKRALTITNEDLSNLKNKFNNQLAETQRISKNLNMLTQPGTRLIAMNAIDSTSRFLASIYWNQYTSEVYINVQSLPVPPSEKQYQLWAIVDGAPVDIGVFDVTADKAEIHKMKSVDNPQAFAVTLENKGGSPTPTMDQMYVMGKNG